MCVVFFYSDLADQEILVAKCVHPNVFFFIGKHKGRTKFCNVKQHFVAKFLNFSMERIKSAISKFVTDLLT